ncbi:uncharacterized protein MONBRDRAFT_26419 [Monosiga brevicollis MX1]|uniref:JmjC domain-containing protein n=1 Tax=Monosiga brevicollis TaxID=81824 RepID=A9V2B4_MONBE|nr:uncharacterized protein MONBRDRAFT_26419 [Monosiga brevicollis MX1]EDQ88229.1 predicted protein [Monosiga brevicollis MX1]|eukprot:XP_001746822.1 hypothetical protein [Monosiga brevicollis MX1]
MVVRWGWRHGLAWLCVAAVVTFVQQHAPMQPEPGLLGSRPGNITVSLDCGNLSAPARLPCVALVPGLDVHATWNHLRAWPLDFRGVTASSHSELLYRRSPDAAPCNLPGQDLVRCTQAPASPECQHSLKQHCPQQPHKDTAYLYFSTPLSDAALRDEHQLGLPPRWHHLLQHLPPVLNQTVPDLRAQDKSDLRRRIPRAQPLEARNLWIGSAQVAAKLHYDTSHNLYLQLAGCKSFWLWPPTTIGTVWPVYPALHEHNRQVAVPWTPPSGAETLHADSAATASTPLHVTLEPGQALLLPAYWLHYVRAETASVSVNSWVEAPSVVLLNELLANLLPFASRHWPRDQMAIAIQRYVPAVVSALLPTVEAQRAWSQAHLVQAPSLDAGQSATCSSSRARGLDTLIEPYVRDVVATFQAMPAEEQPILLSVWTQALASLVAPMNEQVSFLTQCCGLAAEEFAPAP